MNVYIEPTKWPVVRPVNACADCKHHLYHESNPDTCGHPKVTVTGLENPKIYLDALLCYNHHCQGEWRELR